MSAPVEKKLDNGLTVLYEKVPGVKVVSVQCWIKTGSVNENEKISGISHFLEHMLFNGTKKFKPGDIDEYLAAKGGYNNAFTSLDVTNYYVTIPTDEAEAAYEVISDMVFNALLLQSEIDREKPVVIAISTANGLSDSSENIGKLLNRKNYYFVPFRQDNPITKPRSLSFEPSYLVKTIEYALDGEQIQPILL